MTDVKRKPKRAETANDLYLRAVSMPNGCLEWQGAITATTGYGKVRFRGKVIDAHRASWIAANGDVPARMDICHTCDNRKCIRPNHLFLGTRSDNMLDASRKGRLPQNYPVGENSPHAKLTEAQVLEIYFLATMTDIPQQIIADRYGIRRQGVSEIKRRKSWRHLLAQFEEEVAA